MIIISKNYQNFLFLGDVNANANEMCKEKFCNLNGLTSSIKKPTYLKNLDNHVRIDLTVITQRNCFQWLCFGNLTFRHSLNRHRKW